MKRILQTILTALVVLSGNAALAFKYVTPLGDSKWSHNGSPYMCSLSHEIKSYGEGLFVHEAGAKQQLILRAHGYQYAKAPISVVSDPPSWRPNDVAKDLGNTSTDVGELRVSGDLATILLTELTQGKLVGFKGTLKDTNSEPLDVYLSSVGIKQAYEDYKRCESKLLSANFKQLERSRIQYSPGKYEISSEGKILLDQLVEYLKVDDSIEQVFVDGHTDDSGLKKENVSISEKRAVEVSNYLLSCGIAEDRIVTRFHGERYPVVKNNSTKHKAKNRRTTIRLSRESKKESPQKTT